MTELSPHGQVRLPCGGVVTHLHCSVPEIEAHVAVSSPQPSNRRRRNQRVWLLCHPQRGRREAGKGGAEERAGVGDR